MTTKILTTKILTTKRKQAKISVFKRAFLSSAIALLPFASAVIAPPLTFTQQAKKASVIVRIKLGLPINTKDSEVNYQAYPITVKETLAGDANTLPKYEGKPALFILAGLADMPQFNTEQELIAMLYSSKMDNPIVGFDQGLYLLKDGKISKFKTPVVTVVNVITVPALAKADPKAGSAVNTPVITKPPENKPPENINLVNTNLVNTNLVNDPPTHPATTLKPPEVAPVALPVPVTLADPYALPDGLSDPVKFREAVRLARESK